MTFGSRNARDLNQDVDDTVKQAAGTDDAFESREQAFQFGHAAQRNSGDHPTWNDQIETQLRTDYGPDFERDRPYICHAYEYRYSGASSSAGQRDESRDRL